MSLHRKAESFHVDSFCPKSDHLELLGMDLSSKLNFGSSSESKSKTAAKKLGIPFKVAGLVGRADVLACMLFLSSLLLYHGCVSRHAVWWSVALAALSMLAKETGLTVLLFNVSFDVYRCWNTVYRTSSGTKCVWRKSCSARVCRVLGALVVLAAARLALLHGTLPTFSPQDNPPHFHPSLLVRCLTFSYLAAFNWWLLLCPWSLSHDWQMGSVPLVTSLLDPRNFLTCAALITLLALSYRCCMDLELQRHTPAVVGVLLLVIPYLPASNLLFTVGFVVAERILYMPSIGSVLLTAYGLQLLWQRSGGEATVGRLRVGQGGWRLLALCVAVLVASGVARTSTRNRDWRTREQLLRADLVVLPHNAKLHYNFGNFLKDIEQEENAIKHYKEALRLWPSYASAHNNLGTLVVASGRAEHHFLQALKYNRNHVNAHYNLGKLYRKKKLISESVRMLERCITLEPRFVRAYLELLQLRPEEEKRGLLQTVIQLEPSHWQHHLMYGNWLKGRGFKPPSVAFYLEAMRLAFRKQPPSRDSVVLSLRATCLVLRELGQHARVLQLLTRWHSWRGGPRAAGVRNLHLREWRLRTELAGRAEVYTRRHTNNVMSTCLHHSQLEVSPDNEISNLHVRAFIYKTSESEVGKVVLANTKVTSECQKTTQARTKRSVSISTQYKPIHNKSDTGLKQISCPLHKSKKIKEPEVFTPYMSDNLIKTY